MALRGMMQRTIFDTPGLSRIMHWAGLLWLRVFGWRMEGRIPDAPKYVLIGAPHTSNWDLPFVLALAFAFRVKIYWLAKETIFVGPFGLFFRWLGGIPVDRSKANGMVAQAIEAFEQNDRLVICIPPEGTRSKVKRWKTGFYYIALGAGVPINLSFMDFGRRAGGFGPLFQPTGDIEADMKEIQAFYAPIRGKRPDRFASAPSSGKHSEKDT